MSLDEARRDFDEKTAHLSDDQLADEVDRIIREVRDEPRFEYSATHSEIEFEVSL